MGGLSGFPGTRQWRVVAASGDYSSRISEKGMTKIVWEELRLGALVISKKRVCTVYCSFGFTGKDFCNGYCMTKV